MLPAFIVRVLGLGSSNFDSWPPLQYTDIYGGGTSSGRSMGGFLVIWLVSVRLKLVILALASRGSKVIP
jgi:hypothetical protein